MNKSPKNSITADYHQTVAIIPSPTALVGHYLALMAKSTLFPNQIARFNHFNKSPVDMRVQTQLKQ